MSSTEINLYTKKLQYLNNVINESYRDLILCAAVCSIPIVLQYIIANVISQTVKMVQ